MLNQRSDDARSHVIERLRGATGSLPRDRVFEEILAHHPFTFTA